ncbi:MAG TPA: hypothetical protein VJX73_10600 [Terracidiphilus sp.]|nr:hypothetical protein [Terracidiphilus sp.]
MRILNLKSLLSVALTVIALVFAVTPCHAQQMDPVKGPMSLQAPRPFFEGSKGGGRYGYSTKSDFERVKSFSYANGETLKGKSEWATAPAAEAQTPAAADSSTPQQNLAAAWDLVYGPGYYASHVAGKKALQGTFTGDKGTTLQVQSLDNFVAVGADNQGNLYKIVW